MADSSDIAKALWDALPREEAEPADLHRAPVLDGWVLYASPNEREVGVHGVAAGSGKFNDGSDIRTSALRAVDANRRFVVTQNSVYRLGWPERASLEPDDAFVWPAVLAVAVEEHWRSAVAKAVEWTGAHTLTEEVRILIDNLANDGDWAQCLSMTREVADFLRQDGRHRVADAWLLLSVDVTKADERSWGNDLVARAAEIAARTYGRETARADTFAEHGWRSLAHLDKVSVERMIRRAELSHDPVVAAHEAGMLALRSKTPPSVIDEVFVNPEIEDEDVLPPPHYGAGVVVLRELGGTAASTAGKEVRAEFAKILGKPLPLVPVGDLTAARLQLHAEFPHAATQVDILLSDLSGAEHVRFRPTLIVGAPGGGKSRLARRLAEVLGVGLYRYDGAGSIDNAFGGTPRRWTTGEHCAPLEAVRRHGIANPIVMVDEIDKSGRSRQNGSLPEALMPFLEVETSKTYPDPYAQAEVDLSHVAYLLTANRDEDLLAPLRDRLRIVRMPQPSIDHLPALARGIVADVANERGGDMRWWPHLDEAELAVAETLWAGGSIRRLRAVVERLLAARERAPMH